MSHQPCKQCLDELIALRQQVASLQAERDEAKADQRELSEIHMLLSEAGLHGRTKRGVLYVCQDRVEILTATNTRLREALRKYGQHLNTCGMNLTSSGGLGGVDWRNTKLLCTCGLTAALAEEQG